MDKREIGQFHHSFVVRIIRDFFLSLLLLMALELGIRFLLAVYAFEIHASEQTRIAAQQLSADLKSIMLNKGGPVASRTVFPILRRNHLDVGLEIAVVPSELTLTSVQKVFNFKPKGLAPKWSVGKHHESRVELQADSFCLQCHVDAGIGDVLGSVVVRNYFSSHVRQWWEQANLTSVIGLMNIVFHTIILYSLLKWRMLPLLLLKTTVSKLAKGGMGVTGRTEVQSNDEFGELAQDLNSFLERISQLAYDFEAILQRLAGIDLQLKDIANACEQQVFDQKEQLGQIISNGFTHLSTLAERTSSPFATLEKQLHMIEQHPVEDSLLKQSIVELLRTAKAMIRTIDKDLSSYGELGQRVVGLDEHLHQLSLIVGEIRVLSEKMHALDAQGHILLEQLGGRDAD